MGEPKFVPDVSKHTDDEIDRWIGRLIDAGRADGPQCKLLFEERARRQSKVLSVDKSLAALASAAEANRFTTYSDLAAASGVPFNKVRYVMNGAKGHLDRLLEICHAREMPLLTALCVTRDAAATGELSGEALEGFVKGAQRLGYKVTDKREFLQQCQRECFEWAAQRRTG